MHIVQGLNPHIARRDFDIAIYTTSYSIRSRRDHHRKMFADGIVHFRGDFWWRFDRETSWQTLIHTSNYSEQALGSFPAGLTSSIKNLFLFRRTQHLLSHVHQINQYCNINLLNLVILVSRCLRADWFTSLSKLRKRKTKINFNIRQAQTPDKMIQFPSSTSLTVGEQGHGLFCFSVFKIRWYTDLHSGSWHHMFIAQPHACHRALCCSSSRTTSSTIPLNLHVFYNLFWTCHSHWMLLTYCTVVWANKWTNSKGKYLKVHRKVKGKKRPDMPPSVGACCTDEIGIAATCSLTPREHGVLGVGPLWQKLKIIRKKLRKSEKGKKNWTPASGWS